MSSRRQSGTNKALIPSAPPRPGDPPGVYPSLPLHDQHLNDLAASKKKFVKVSGVGEMEIEPDRIEFCIKITSTKTDLKECRSSVQKRLDYIIAIMKKSSIRDRDIKCTEMVSKTTEDSNYEDEVQHNIVNNNNEQVEGAVNNAMRPQILQKQPKLLYTVVKELIVKVDSIAKYLQISSICTEKLDFRVVVSEPIIQFSSELIDSSTEIVLEKAVSNSRKKAESLIASNNKRILSHPSSPFSSVPASGNLLGPLIYSLENYCLIENIVHQDPSSEFESFRWKKYNKQIKTQITSVYEIVLSDKERSRKAVI